MDHGQEMPISKTNSTSYINILDNGQHQLFNTGHTQKFTWLVLFHLQNVFHNKNYIFYQQGILWGIHHLQSQIGFSKLKYSMKQNYIEHKILCSFS